MGVDELLQQRLVLRAERRGGPFGTPRREVLLHGAAGALQRAVRRGDAGAEQSGRLVGGPAEDVARDERRALPGWQQLHRRKERQLDRLALDGDRVRLLIARRGLVEQSIRVRLQPRHLRERAHFRQPARVAAQHVEAHVRRDPIQPGTEQQAAIEALARTPRVQQRLLHGILGLIE